jgi:hypothetical protein
LKQAGIDYAQAAKSALAWRNDFLYELAKAKAEMNETKVEKEWKAHTNRKTETASEEFKTNALQAGSRTGNQSLSDR